MPDEDVTFRLELLILQVSDVDRAKSFYAEQLGWHVDVDHATPHVRVLQLTPPGSACSINLMHADEPVPHGRTHLCVDDVEVARALLVAGGVEVSEPFHFGLEGQTPGLHPTRERFNTFCEFTDPDGNGWVLQEAPPAT